MPPCLHLGVNTCFAVKRWPEPERWIALVREDLGLDCCQLSLDLVDPLLDEAATASYAAEVRTRAAMAGLELHSTFSGLAAYSWSQLLHPDAAMRTAAMRWYERAIRFTAQLGAAGTGGYLGALSVRDAADAARQRHLHEELAGRLHTLSATAAAAGLQFVLYENMAVTREWASRIAEAQALGRLAVPGAPLVLCLDVGHPCALPMETADADPLAWLTEPWPRTPVLHLQQTERGSDHHWPFTDTYNRLGLIRPAEVLAALRAWEAEDVYLFLEVMPPFEADDAVVLDDVRTSVRYWRDAIAQEAGQEGDSLSHKR